MQRTRLLRWSGNVLAARKRAECIISPFSIYSRSQATAAAPAESNDQSDGARTELLPSQTISEDILSRLPSPPVSAAKTSSKLAALHARISLPSRLPIETLARTLVDPTADPSTKFNNSAFAFFGSDLLNTYTSEYIISQYPRLPMPVVFAAMYAYVGPKALSAISGDWGIEHVAEPGGEVDPGLLQFRQVPPDWTPEHPSPDVISTAPEGDSNHRRSIGSRIVYDDPFGEMRKDHANKPTAVTLESAGANFVRAVMGAVYLHAGRVAAKQFYRDHFMSRQLNIGKLFQFSNPTRDLAKLCAREGFQKPVARLESETGRQSRHPVFVVGVYSGNDILGEGVGASRDDARISAAIAALKGWYLYSPLEFRLPSEMEEPGARPWKPLLVDQGEVIGGR